MAHTIPREKRKRSGDQDSQSTPPKKTRSEGRATQKDKPSKAKTTKENTIKGQANPRSKEPRRTDALEAFNKQCHRFPVEQLHDAFVMFLEEYGKLKTKSPIERQQNTSEAMCVYLFFRCIHTRVQSIAILEDALPALMEQESLVETAMKIFEKTKEDGINGIIEAMHALKADQHIFDAATAADSHMEAGLRTEFLEFQDDYLGKVELVETTLPETQRRESEADSAEKITEPKPEEPANDLDLDVAEDKLEVQPMDVSTKREATVQAPAATAAPRSATFASAIAAQQSDKTKSKDDEDIFGEDDLDFE